MARGMPLYVMENMYKQTRKQQDIYKIMYVCTNLAR